MAPTQEIPPIPVDLKEQYHPLWTEFADRLGYSGRWLLFEQALFCLQRADECRGMLAKQGLTLTTQKTKMKHVNPLLKIEKEARDTFFKIWKLLGFYLKPTTFTGL